MQVETIKVLTRFSRFSCIARLHGSPYFARIARVENDKKKKKKEINTRNRINDRKTSFERDLRGKLDGFFFKLFSCVPLFTIINLF